MAKPGPIAHLARAILAAFRGRNGLYLLIAYVLYRKFTATFLKFRLRTGETCREYLGRIALLLPPAKQSFSKEITKQLVDMRARAKRTFDEFGFVKHQMPDNGLSMRELKTLVDDLAAIPQKHCEKDHMSGSIYSFSYWKNKSEENKAGSQPQIADIDAPSVPQSAEDYLQLSRKLKQIYTYSFETSYLWNSLHSKEFGVGDFLSYQVVRMAADLYGAKPDEVMGFVTSGGTESIMTAVRAYRDWGISNRGLGLGEGVILAAKSVHAAFMKGGLAYNVQVKLLPVDEYDQVDLRAVRKAVKRLGNRLIAIVGSTPSYGLGTVDDIPGLAAIAQRAGVGMHVDSCLGGFIVNFVESVNSNFLKIPGITSLSCDTHKNGWAPKGSSVCIMKEIPDSTFGAVNLAYYAMYAIPAWSGGVYGTPNNAGSQHCTHALHAYLAMLAIGKNGYRKLAQDVNSTCRQLAEVVSDIPEFKLLVAGDGTPKANVVGWAMSDAVKKSWGAGAIYAVAHEMAQRGIVLSALNGFRVHYCVTSRSAGDPNFVEKFREALEASMVTMRENAQRVIRGEMSFPGDAGLYGTLEAAMEPEVSRGGVGKYVENFLFGVRGVQDAVKSYFLGLADPYATEPLPNAK